MAEWERKLLSSVEFLSNYGKVKKCLTKYYHL